MTNRKVSTRKPGPMVKLVKFCSAVILLLLFLSSSLDLTWGCNEAVCASMVSKCILTKSCKCELTKNCTCCKECFDCLSYLYAECCSCVELCPKPNASMHLAVHSQVGDLKESMPELFEALTSSGEDSMGRWSVLHYPIDIDQSWFHPEKVQKTVDASQIYTVADGKITIDPTKEVVTVNCTVAFMSQCLPLNKCRNSCSSTGASYFRWFHDGCCECIGSTCINYGIDESRCTECSMNGDEEEDEDDEEGGEDDKTAETTDAPNPTTAKQG